MRIILAAPRGFCAGVNMAIESLRLALETFGAPLYVYHEIVHNRWVVERFRQQGAVFVDRLDDVPEGAYLMYSAHGVAPDVRRLAAARRLSVIDATCPLVTKVHLEAIRFSQAGYTVLLIGHAGHDEVLGVLGEAPQAITLVQSLADVDRLQPLDPTRLAYVTQTTLSVDDAARIIGRLKERFPQIVGAIKDDICYATQNRQQAVRELSAQASRVLVVGSQNSSNSRRLKELAESSGTPAHLIDSPADIDPAWFQPHDSVVITAGASAPEDVVQECVAFLLARFGGQVEHTTVRHEGVRFPLPETLRK